MERQIIGSGNRIQILNLDQVLISPQEAEKLRLEERQKAKNKAIETKPVQVNSPQTNAPNLEGYIYVPSVDLCFAKERSCLGKDWYDAHKELQKQKAKMPTIPEFIEFLKHLRDNPSNENTQIYNDITEVSEPWRAEWLDADFKVKKKQLYVNYNHKLDSSGNLVPQNSELLEECLMKDCYADILNPNKQGFPTKESKNQEFYFWYPRDDNNSVAGFNAGSVRAGLDCYWDPVNSISSLGVRVVVRPKGAGMKK